MSTSCSVAGGNGAAVTGVRGSRRLDAPPSSETLRRDKVARRPADARNQRHAQAVSQLSRLWPRSASFWHPPSHECRCGFIARRCLRTAPPRRQRFADVRMRACLGFLPSEPRVGWVMFVVGVCSVPPSLMRAPASTRRFVTWSHYVRHGRV